MAFKPEPTTIRKTSEEIEAEEAALHLHGHGILGGGDPGGQVNPFKANPNRFARYQMLQNGREVGWVYVDGESGTRCTEHWQIYTRTITGDGEKLPDGTVPPRALYTWPSQGNFIGEAVDVTTRLVYRGDADSIKPPENASGEDYQAINASCLPG